MPTVPTQFVPQVDPTESRQGAYQAFPVQPMDNYAPRQLEAAGQRSLDLGNTVFRAGVLLQDARNDAMTRQIESMAMGEANDLINGEKGYKRTLLKDADDKYIPTVDALSGIAERALSMTENDVQRAMLTPALARNFSAAKNQVIDHRSTQVLKWNISEHQARAGQYAQGAVNEIDSIYETDEFERPKGKFRENLAIAHNEMHDAGVLMGIAEGSTQMRDLHRAVDTQVAQGVVNRFMNKNNYRDALRYINQENKLGNLQEDAYQRMLTSVTASREIQIVDEIGTSIMETGMKTSFSMFEFKSAIADTDTLDTIIDKDNNSITVVANEGSAIRAPQSCTVGKVKRDKDGSYSVVLESEDGTNVMFENLRGPNLPQEGEVLERDEEFAKVGNSNQPSTRITASRNGEAISPLNLNSFSNYDRETVEKPKTIQAALREANDIPDVERRRRVKADLQQKFAERAMVDAKNREDLLNKVTTKLAEPGMSLAKLPKDLLASLDPKDMAMYMKTERELRDQEFKVLVTIKPSILTEIEEKSNKNAPDVTWLEAHRFEMSPPLYLEFLKMTQEPDKLLSATIDADSFDVHFMRGGLTSLANPTKESDKLRSAMYRDEIKKRVRYQQKRSGVKLEEEEVGKIMDQVIMDKAMVDKTFFDEKKGVAEMTDEEIFGAYTVDDSSGQMIPLISPSKRKAIVDALNRKNILPTNSEIIKLFKEMRRYGE